MDSFVDELLACVKLDITAAFRPEHLDAASALEINVPEEYSRLRDGLSAAGVDVEKWDAARKTRSDDASVERAILERGDEVEVAALLVNDMKFDGVPAVGDRGSLYYYNSGIYSSAETDELTAQLSTYVGRPVLTSKGQRRPLRLSFNNIRGATRLAVACAATRGFFDDPRNGVAFTNGYVVIENGAPMLLSHSPEHRARHRLEFDYVETAAAPLWLGFLGDIWRGASDLEQRIALIEEFIGASMLGRATTYQKCLVLVGEGENGKSTLLKVIQGLFSRKAVRSLKPQKWGERFSAAALVDCYINIVNEMPDVTIEGGDVFKAIVSGEEIEGEIKYRDIFRFKCICGHIFSANRLPGTKDHSSAYWRRWLVLACDRKFLPSEIDRDMADRLFKELPAIAARCIAAAARLEARHHYEVPASSLDLIENWKVETNQVAQFVNEDRWVDTQRQVHVKEGWMTATAIYSMFSDWSKANGHTGMTSTTFGLRLKELLPREKRNGVHCYKIPSQWLVHPVARKAGK